jgi:hypothetical protein
LPFIPILGDDADVRVAWNQAIYKVGCVPVLIIVLKNEPPVVAAVR